jgi:hypothetical protein
MARRTVQTQEKQTRNKPAKSYTVEDVDFVFKNYSQMSATEIAGERGLATFQVNQIVTGLRQAGAPLPKKTRKSIISEYVESLPKKRGRRKTA